MDVATIRAGLNWWLANKKDWGPDLLNRFYNELYAERPSRLDEKWWNAAVRRLAAWRAIRSPRPPNSAAEMLALGAHWLDGLDARFQRILRRADGQEPSLAGLTWEDIEPLFDYMYAVKGTASPVFASKLGHFLFPNAFIVLDNLATGIFPYEVVWRGMQQAWNDLLEGEKETARKLLVDQIRSTGATVHPNYPFETKIAELWLIGRNYPKVGGSGIRGDVA